MHLTILRLLATGKARDAPQAFVDYQLNAPALLRLVSAVILGKAEEIHVAVDAYLEAYRHIVGATGIGLAQGLKS